MGGNAFKNEDIRRISLREIPETLSFITETLNINGLDLPYLKNNLMGSVGKQDDSGDIDIAINDRPCVIIGQPDYPVFSLKYISSKCRNKLGDEFVNSSGLKGGQIQTLFPIMGDRKNGLIQVDFISGNPEWLKFSHYSPGLYKSQYKGVFISTILGVLAKSIILFREGENKISWGYDLEKGLHIRWEMILNKSKHTTSVNPDIFESKIQCPRFPRLGYLTNPQDIVRILFGGNTMVSDVDTMEKIVNILKNRNNFLDIKERTIQALLRSSMKKYHTYQSLSDLPLWK